MQALRWTSAALLLAASCQLPPDATEPATPNVVVFFVDDLGWQDVGEPFWRERTRFNERYRTPNLERLCREGTKLTNAYAHQVCTPSRVSLMTGAAVARHRRPGRRTRRTRHTAVPRVGQTTRFPATTPPPPRIRRKRIRAVNWGASRQKPILPKGLRTESNS